MSFSLRGMYLIAMVGKTDGCGWFRRQVADQVVDGFDKDPCSQHRLRAGLAAWQKLTQQGIDPNTGGYFGVVVTHRPD